MFEVTRLSLHESAAHGANLDHGGDVGLDVGLVGVVEGVVLDGILEVGRVEGARDETLVDTARGAEETKGDDGEPEPPVEDALGLAGVSQAEDVDWLLDTTSHCEKMGYGDRSKRGEEEEGEIQSQWERKGDSSQPRPTLYTPSQGGGGEKGTIVGEEETPCFCPQPSSQLHRIEERERSSHPMSPGGGSQY